MIKIENTEVFGWEAAIRGMRNPKNSWDKSDSKWTHFPKQREVAQKDGEYSFVIGENDLKLMKTLSAAGSDHGKFLRMINVTFDLTAPLYFLKEWDTYKIATVSNSCSTMHKIHAKEFALDDFSHEHLGAAPCALLKVVCNELNYWRRKFIETNEKEYWWQMIQLLPSSYNQRRTVQLNYQVLKNMYHARKNHKLDEWREFCKWCESLPYFREVVIQDGSVEND